jgi:hypothetical protein
MPRHIPARPEQSQSPKLTERLRGIRVMVAELASAADDRFDDLAALGAGIARIAKHDDPTVSRLGSIVEYLAGDGAAEVSYKLNELTERIDAAIEEVEGRAK